MVFFLPQAKPTPVQRGTLDSSAFWNTSGRNMMLMNHPFFTQTFCVCGQSMDAASCKEGICSVQWEFLLLAHPWCPTEFIALVLRWCQRFFNCFSWHVLQKYFQMLDFSGSEIHRSQHFYCNRLPALSPSYILYPLTILYNIKSKIIDGVS